MMNLNQSNQIFKNFKIKILNNNNKNKIRVFNKFKKVLMQVKQL